MYKTQVQQFGSLILVYLSAKPVVETTKIVESDTCNKQRFEWNQRSPEIVKIVTSPLLHYLHHLVS